MKRILAFIVVLLLASGCGFLTPKAPVCDTDQPSVLCAAAAKLNMSLDDIATALKIGNITGLSTDTYTAQEALDFIDEIDLFLDSHGDMTYSVFVIELMARFTSLSPTVQALFILASADYDLNIDELEKDPLTEYDYYLLRKHLEKQRMLIVPYLVG